MKRIIAALLMSVLLTGALVSCKGKEKQKDETTVPVEETGDPGSAEDTRYQFDGKVSEEVLCHYLSRAVTIASRDIDEWAGQNGNHIRHYILNTGAKYIARANDAWGFSDTDDNKWDIQKTFIEEMHEADPDIVFEACIFENIWKWGVEQIAIPAFVFEAFDREPEDRHFDYTKMIFKNGQYVNQWGDFQSVPDITSEETQMFFYYRAVRYIDAGFEALHLGQVNLMGAKDKNWSCFTKLVGMIREYASGHARRHFVFLNAHTHGIVGDDGVLLFDFHMYPMRPAPAPGQQKHGPSEDLPQEAVLEAGYVDAIYGDSLGGLTYSGWECDSLPYMVEFDNFGGVNDAEFFQPKRDGIWIWGMDEISWFGSQPEWYREEFLEYAVDWIAENSGGKGFLAMPAQREARLYAESGECLSLMYYGYSKEFFGVANDDELLVKALWKKMEKNGR